MRIGVDGDLSRRVDLEAWAAQIAAMHLSVSRMASGVKTETQQGHQGVPTIGPAEALRAQVLSSRQGQMTVQDGLGYVQVAGADLERSQDVLRRMRVVAAQATDGSFDPPQREALQKYVDRSVQEIEGIAEQARYHTLRMLGGTASVWSLPEKAAPAAMAAMAAAPVLPAATLAARSIATPPAPSVATAPAAAQRPAAESSAPPQRASRASVATPEQARDLLGRIDSATEILTQVGRAVDGAEQHLLRTIGSLGLDQTRLPGDPSAPQARDQDTAMRQVTLQSAAQSSATVLVEATRAQFDAVTAVLGSTAAAAMVGAHGAVAPRDAAMASRPAVEPVTTTSRSSRPESGRERGDRGGTGGGVSRR